VALEDTRPVAPAADVVLDPLSSAVFLAADRVATPRAIARAFAAEGNERSEAEVARVLDDLERRLIVHHDDGHYLALATRVPDSAATDVEREGVTRGYSWRHLGYST
jgi:hypothetical protein